MTDTRAKILARCIEEGDCLIWTGACSSGDRPVTWIDGKVQSIRTFLYKVQGRGIPDGYRVTCTCDTPKCVAHLTALARNKEKLGKKHTLAQRYKQSVARRDRGTKITPEQVCRIKAHTDNAKDLADELGINISHIHRIRAGKVWREYSSPWAGLCLT